LLVTVGRQLHLRGDFGLVGAVRAGRADVSAGLNWAGNYAYRAPVVYQPNSVEEVQEVVAREPTLHALGSRHSFTDLADSDGALISLERLDPGFELALDRGSVTVSGGTRYGAVGQYLAEHGLSLRNYASLPHISVAGAIATGTHGSGDHNRGLAADVRALDVVLASGELRHCSAATLGGDYLGVAVGLGALGVVVRAELEVVPAFEVRQSVYENLAWAQFDEHVDEITALAYSVSMFTDYSERGIRQLWLKCRTDAAAPPADVFGARPATDRAHPIPGVDAVNTTEQFGIPGPPHDRLPHFRIGFTPSNGAEIQSEYLIDRRHLVAAVHAIRAVAEHLTPLIHTAELRTVGRDELWLSPSGGRETAALHFTWRPQQADVEVALGHVERALAPFDPRPHWGKLFVGDAARLAEAYPLLPRFRELAEQWDPAGKFRNAFLDRYVFS
jgi:alditol oxidase